MSEEHRALGYRPPHGSLAATAQAAAARHPDAHAGVDATTLAQAALQDAKHIEASRASKSPSSASSSPSSTKARRASDVSSVSMEPLQFATIAAPEARILQSEE